MSKDKNQSEFNTFIQNKIQFTPCVSVIIPVYNAGPYLRECLDSVLGQSLHEIEVICVDDGSTDNSLEILCEYAARDNRLMVIGCENNNAGAARNVGLSFAKGEYLGFIDADDFISTDMFKKLYNKSKRSDLDICLCSFQMYNNKTKQYSASMGFNKHIMNLCSKSKDDDIINLPHSPILQIINMGPTNKIYKRSTIEKNNILFQSIKSTNDMAFVAFALVCADKIGIVDENLYFYRTNTGVSLTDNKCKAPLCFYEALKELGDRLRQSGKYEDYKETFINLVVGVCLYNIKKVSVEIKKLLVDKCLNEIFPEYSITKESLDIIYDNNFKTLLLQLFDLNKTAAVSIVLPIYNAGPYLRECLDSIVNQTLKNIEIICVNDGSTDNSMDIIQEYAGRDMRICYIDKPNAGYGQTMNCGINAATGEYIGIVEPDDYIALDSYERMYARAKQGELDIVKGNLAMFTGDKKRKFEVVKYLTNDNFYDVVDTPYNLQPYMATTFNTCSAIYRKEFLTKNNIRYNETPGAAYQDTSFWFQTHCQAKKMALLDYEFYKYRRDNPNQSIRNTKLGDFLIGEYDFIRNFLQENQKSEFWPLYFYRKFKGFWWYFNLLTPELKQGFLHKMHKSIKSDFDLKLADTSQFNSSEISQLEKLVSDNYVKNFEHLFRKFSVIVPVYNTEKYLAECLDSIINQTIKNIEIICIDDGSTDESAKLLREYATRDNRIKIISQTNQGLSVARNNAIKIACGEYLCFVDSDDYLVPNALETLYEHITKHDLDMLSYSGKNFQDGTKNFESNEYWNFNYLPDGFDTTCFAWRDCSDFAHKMAVSSCLTIYKNSFVKIKELKFPAGLCFEDNIFFHHALFNATKCGILDEKLYMRRIHSASITQNRDKHVVDIVKIIDMLLEFLKSNKVNNSVLENFVNTYCGTIWWTWVKLPQKTKKKHYKSIRCLFEKWNFFRTEELKKSFVMRFGITKHKEKYHAIYFFGKRISTRGIVRVVNSVTYPITHLVHVLNKRSFSQKRKFISDKFDRLDKAVAKLADLSESSAVATQEKIRTLGQQVDYLLKKMDTISKNSVHAQNSIEKIPEIIKQNVVLTSEPYWANVYHDTIINSAWLKNKSVSPGRWAVSYIVLYVLYRVLDEFKPKSILECGLGQSSKLTMQYADAYNADLIVCENNPEWVKFFLLQMPSAEKYVKMHDLDMVEIVAPHKSRTYANFADTVRDKKFNLVVIDGPLGSAHYSRPEILDVVDSLDTSFVIMLDDMNRIGEQEIWDLLKKRLTDCGIKFVENIYSSDKSVGLLCSPDLDFLTSL